MKNQFVIRSVAIVVYALAAFLLFLISKGEVNAIYRYFAVGVGLIVTMYFIPFSLIKSIRKDLPFRDYLIASDIILFLTFAYMILIVLAANPLFKMAGITIRFINLLFCVIIYFKFKKSETEIKKLLYLHIVLAFMPVISY